MSARLWSKLTRTRNRLAHEYGLSAALRVKRMNEAWEASAAILAEWRGVRAGAQTLVDAMGDET